MMLQDHIKNRPKIIKIRKWNGIIEDIINVGDRVRHYDAFVKEEGYIVDWNNYLEGTVIAKKKSILDYELTIKKEKVVFAGRVYTENFTFGDTTFYSSRSELLELQSPQLSL